MAVAPIHERRFNALAGYSRAPFLVLAVQEYDWLATDDERVLGVLTWDRSDFDFGWIALARDEQLRYRAVEMNASHPTTEAARAALVEAMLRLQRGPDTEFHQGDTKGPPVDFFAPVVPCEAFHTNFKLLLEHTKYSPALELIASMMRYYEDADGNFIEQFQTTAFDARLWELYLFATFTELGFAAAPEIQAPDFLLKSLRGDMGVEATTANPSQGFVPPPPQTREELMPYLENYVPIKLARALTRKLNRPRPYWAMSEMEGIPFVLAVQDFHAAGSMRMIVPAATEYVFGVRHSLSDDGQRHIRWIDEHRFGAATEPSGFFRLPNAENVSAVLVNPQGTLLKFNRLGFLAGFGDRRVRMTRVGVRRHENELSDPRPRTFQENVHDDGYQESWVEGMVVLHNPHARIPLDPDLIRGATHEFLERDGRIMSLLPESPPYFSQTSIYLEGDPAPSAED